MATNRRRKGLERHLVTIARAVRVREALINREIARRLGVGKTHVARLITRARARGIVGKRLRKPPSTRGQQTRLDARARLYVLRAVRLRARLTNKALAARFGCSESLVSTNVVMLRRCGVLAPGRTRRRRP